MMDKLDREIDARHPAPDRGIGWAVERLRAGLKVRRRAWLEDEHVYSDTAGNWLKWLSGWNCPVVFLARREDLEAVDWESAA